MKAAAVFELIGLTDLHFPSASFLSRSREVRGAPCRRAVIFGESASSHPSVVASSLMPPKEQGQAEDDGADGDGQPEEGVVAHPVMVPLVQLMGLPITTPVVLTTLP
jgi:hypothetical protein